MTDLMILPFDHRGTFNKKMYGVETLSEEQRAEVQDFKHLIYEGFKKALSLGVPKASAGILVDEEFGRKVLEEARAEGFTFCMANEKSGQKEFDFEHPDWQDRIAKYEPTYAKILLRYNPEDDDALNERQLAKVKLINDFCRGSGRKLLVEPLVPGTEEQLRDGQEAYDAKVRPGLMVRMMAEFQGAGIAPHVWKVEGVDSVADCEALVAQARKAPDGDVIILGRGASAEKVEEWLRIGAKVEGVTGFAVGRTIFWDALVNYRDGALSRADAVALVAENFKRFVDVWLRARG